MKKSPNHRPNFASSTSTAKIFLTIMKDGKIYKNLIKDLVEARVELDALIYHLDTVEEPTDFFVGLSATDIGIRKLQDVLVVGVFLVRTSGL